MEVSPHYFRYLIALVILLYAPPALMIWLLIHPFASIWRRLGIVPSYLFLIIGMISLDWCIWQARTWLMGVEYGSAPGLFGLSILFICAAGFVRRQRKRHLDWSMVIGLPELSASNRSRVLVTEGIYSQTRNPRYLEAILFFSAWLFLRIIWLFIWPWWLVCQSCMWSFSWKSVSLPKPSEAHMWLIVGRCLDTFQSSFTNAERGQPAAL
jgi:protein-S-isoprenylcysteine O-methyltransferase Ste14